ncbi:uncharacterized protein LOC119949179 [Tachyglossus aculeatus]|uniref:uncharacterized protein LOC119949179 n=1 Tax=Tachyglossus aculeatus TaxID=9261 RepID=UPI0018F414C1|nr:uncharacterized protein LOC119949179 [Tachyglossus aculeatus]
MQFVGKEVKYLGHLISEGSKKLDPARISGILQIQLPKTKRELRKFLGLVGWCVDRGVALGVLAQQWGRQWRPVAFLSKILDPVAQGWPTCVQAVAAMAIMVEESRKLTFGGSLVDLQESPIPDSVNLFIDGSSRVVEGKRRNGYAIIDGDKTAVVDLGELPNPWSAQTCELYALSRVLKLLKGREGNIYTDSKYAWGVIHVLGKIWEERGMINSQEKESAHTTLLQQVLKDLHLPKALAVVHVNGHQKGSSFEARGNRLADKEARRAGELGQRITDPILVLIPTFPSNLKPVSLSEKEAKGAQDLGAQKDEQGKWVLPDGREVLNEATTRQVLQHLHQGSH